MSHEKHFHIIVNGAQHDWAEKEITYRQVVDIAYDNNPPGGDETTFTVTYSKGKSDQTGFLGPNSKPLNVHEGMEFRVKHSTRS